MIHFNKSYLLAFLMICMPIGVYLGKPTQKIADIKDKLILDTAIPLTFSDWQAQTNKVSLVTELSKEKIYDQTLNRTYTNSNGDRVQLTIAYGSEQTQDLKVHQQEVCYKAQGFNINQLKHGNYFLHDLEVPITQMYATRKDRNEHVTYWFTIGHDVISNRTDRFFTVLKYLFSGYIADGYLIRISTTDANSDEAAYKVHDKFANDLVAALPIATTDRLIGKE